MAFARTEDLAMRWDVEYAPGIRDLVAELMQDLPAEATHKVRWVIELLRDNGLRLVETEHAERVEGNLCVLRVSWRRVQIRLFYFRSGPQKFTILHAFKKRTRALPVAEIQKAREAMMSVRQQRYP